MSDFKAGTNAAAKLLREIADAKDSKSRGGLGNMFADQSAADLRFAADRVEAIEPPVSVGSGEYFATDATDAGRPCLQWIGHGRLSLPYEMAGHPLKMLIEFVNGVVKFEKEHADAR